MRIATRSRTVLACSACMLVGMLLGMEARVSLLADPAPQPLQAPAKAEAPFPPIARLSSNIYMQNAAEYRAVCHCIYKGAALRLEADLANSKPKVAKPAIVMDLDETVFDNSAYQTFLLNNDLEYTEESWSEYEQNHPQEVTLVPGAKRFIERAEQLGVSFVYMSNSSVAAKASTSNALVLNGIDVTNIAVRLYLIPKGCTSDKAARRETVLAKFNVLMYFGDNLRDFSEFFRAAKLGKDATADDYLKAIRQRATQADDAICHWGIDWFALPNPVYGEWERLIGPNPKALLRPTTMKVDRPASK